MPVVQWKRFFFFINWPNYILTLIFILISRLPELIEFFDVLQREKLLFLIMRGLAFCDFSGRRCWLLVLKLWGVALCKSLTHALIKSLNRKTKQIFHCSRLWHPGWSSDQNGCRMLESCHVHQGSEKRTHLQSYWFGRDGLQIAIYSLTRTLYCPFFFLFQFVREI